jgi:hypothetical protein
MELLFYLSCEGKGIYFSLYSDYAMWYSEERGSSQILMCKLLTGKSYQCTGRMDGQDRMPGYDSHYSPSILHFLCLITHHKL